MPRITCGTSSPTKPIGPASEMPAPTTSEAAKKLIVVVRVGSTPTDAAASGPALKAFLEQHG